jgi:DNA-binding transcriptional LysR family regulator
MDLRQLRYFVAAAEHLSLSKAARQLHLSVTPVSRTIQQLEAEFGANLFVHNRRRIALTDVGQFVLQEAKRLLAAADSMADSVRMVTQGTAGLVKVGMMAGVEATLNPKLIRHAKQFPLVEIRIREMTSSDQNDALVEGAIDVGFLRPPVDEVHLDCTPLHKERLVVLLSKRSPLAKRKPRSLRIIDIAKEPLLLPSGNWFHRTVFDKVLQLYRNLGIVPLVRFVSTSATMDSSFFKDTQQLSVACRKGIAIVHAGIPLRYRSRELIAVPLKDPDAYIEVFMAWRKKERSATILAFIDSMRNRARETRSDNK